MILKLPKEINRKIRSNCTIWLYAIIHTIYRILEKDFFMLYKESKKNGKINVYLVGNTDDSSILLTGRPCNFW